MGALADLPGDVLVAILVRLPARSILLCRKVSRAWRSAISHPNFDTAHAQRPASVVKVTTADGPGPTFSPGTNIVLDLFRGRWHRDNVHTNRARPRTLTFPSNSYSVRARGSWDGVVCIELRLWTTKWLKVLIPPPPPYPHADKYVLWNPITKASATVSPPADGGEIMGAYSHPSTRRFHLVHASGKTGGDRLMAPTSFRILTVGRDAVWREIPLTAYPEWKISMAGHHARCVRSHGNLHWLVLWGSESALRLLSFDTAREKFRLMEAPPATDDDVTRARLGVQSGGKLCTFIIEPSTSTMAMWVLDDCKKSMPLSSIWRLKERISLVLRDKSDLSQRFCMDTEVEVVEGVREGEEIFHRHNDGTSRIDAYNLGRKEWRKVNFSPSACLLMHRESVLRHRVSFGGASKALSRTGDPYTHILHLS